MAYRGPAKRKGFAQIPNVVLLDKSLSCPAKVLYGLMVGYAMQHEAFETDQSGIAEDMGCTDRAIRKWMKELLDAGLLTITRRGLNQPNVYLIEDAYALYDQKKPEPKNPPISRWDRNNGSGPDRNNHSGPGRNTRSGQERNNHSGPYLKEKNLKKEEKERSFSPAAFPGADKATDKAEGSAGDKAKDARGYLSEAQQRTNREGAARLKAAIQEAEHRRRCGEPAEPRNGEQREPGVLAGGEAGRVPASRQAARSVSRLTAPA